MRPCTEWGSGADGVTADAGFCASGAAQPPETREIASAVTASAAVRRAVNRGLRAGHCRKFELTHEDSFRRSKASLIRNPQTLAERQCARSRRVVGLTDGFVQERSGGG